MKNLDVSGVRTHDPYGTNRLEAYFTPAYDLGHPDIRKKGCQENLVISWVPHATLGYSSQVY